MNSIEVNLSEIKSNPNNPRIIKDDKFHKLVESIKTFPRMLEIRPIVVNKDMIVLGGNMRLRACKEAGIKKVPVIFAHDLTEEQQREFIIKDNVGFGEWDWAMLANEWDTNELTEWGLDIPDFETKEWLEIVKTAICNYGLAVGLLWQIKQQGSVVIDQSGLIVGYPNAEEKIKLKGQTIEISGGSETDSNTRTKSCLMAWFATAGFVIPNSILNVQNPEKIHLETNEYIIGKETRNKAYKKFSLPDIFYMLYLS